MRHKSVTRDSTLNKISAHILLPLLDQFRDEGRKTSKTFRFWDDCLESLQIFSLFIRAERESDWDLHLNSLARMLPYFFICDKPNYSRWGSVYLIDMLLSLPAEVQSSFKNKQEHAVRFTSNPFRGLWTDMGIEMSVIRDTKGDNGYIDFMAKDSTILRWAITQNSLAAILLTC